MLSEHLHNSFLILRQTTDEASPSSQICKNGPEGGFDQLNCPKLPPALASTICSTANLSISKGPPTAQQGKC